MIRKDDFFYSVYVRNVMNKSVIFLDFIYLFYFIVLIFI